MGIVIVLAPQGVEFELARDIPASKVRKITRVTGIMAGVLSEWAYRQLENAADCIVDFRLKNDQEDRVRNQVRIRSARNTRFDGRWHELQVDATTKVTLTR